jgi:broad specificity phosphatase PhoE
MAGLMLAVPALASAQKLVYIVRHAERADGGTPAPSMNGAADPPLSDIGRARAQKLAAMLGASGVTAIYATEFIRTKETAAPLAAALKLVPVLMSSADSAALVARVKADHPHDIVLIVGHSNSVPAIIKAFGGPAVTIADDEYDKLFVVVPSSGAVSVIKY